MPFIHVMKKDIKFLKNPRGNVEEFLTVSQEHPVGALAEPFAVANDPGHPPHVVVST